MSYMKILLALAGVFHYLRELKGSHEKEGRHASAPAAHGVSCWSG